MKTKHVVVLPYDAKWKSDFEKIRQEIENAIGDLIVGVEHVGSTSVDGLSAKPCIDIDVVIEDYSVFDDVIDKLESIGYIHEGNLGIEDREAFKYLDKPHLQTHHLYVCPQQSRELHRHITFRDFLRKNPEAVKMFLKEYEASINAANNDIETTSALCEQYGIIPKAPVAKKAIPNCNISYIDGADMKASVSANLQIFFDANPKSIGGKLPSDDFYFGA